MKNVQEKIGYTFKNVNLLETALTHSSYANECKKENNERLEFLGDSVLSVIISDYIFRRLPNVDEGWLSKYRQRASIVSDAFEAVLAAIYLDGGMETARKWVIDLMRDSINEVVTGHGYADYKTMLQEALQKGTQGKVTYRTIGESGLDHNKVFEVEVLVDDVPKNKGTGHSKKEAEQNAAHTLLKSMGKVQ